MVFTKTQAVDKILKLKKRIRVIQGGSSAGKTIAIMLILIDMAQSDKTPTITSVVSESIPHLKRGAMRDFRNIMESHKYWKDANWNVVDSTYRFESGSIIEFFSSDNGDKLRGARRDRLFINEANNVTLDAFEQLEVRTKSFVFLDYNPTQEFWVYEIMKERNDCEFIILTYKDNESLDERIVASLEQRINRKGFWQVYGLGLLGEIEGKIYKDWAIIDEIPHEARLERYGLDFGYTNDPSALVAVYYYNGGYILDEILYAKGMTNKQIADTIKELPKALIVADSAEPKSIDEIKSFRYGMDSINIVPAQKGRDSVCNSIQIVQEQSISVTKRSVNIIHEYRNYMWETDRDGEVLNVPEHAFKHSMDAIAYAMTSIVPEKRKSVMWQWNHYLSENKGEDNPAL